MNRHFHGFVTLLPLLTFIIVYIATPLVFHDDNGNGFQLPIAVAFLFASIVGILIARGPLSKRLDIFSQGASDKNILLMIWIFVLAGAFARSAHAIGAVNATVNLALQFLPQSLIFVGVFFAACFISLSVGTSVGTIVALVPIAAGIAQHTGTDIAFVTAIVVGGAFFGDNLSFISDTTIAATQLLGCKMNDKFKANILIVLPASVVVAIIYYVMGHNLQVAPVIGEVDFVKVIPYLAVIILSLMGISVMVVLLCGIILSFIVGMLTGTVTFMQFLTAMGDGIDGMGQLIIVTLLAGGMLQLIRAGGGIDYIISLFEHRLRGKRGAELVIAGLVSLCNLCTANNTIAIITVGPIARDIVHKFRIDPRKAASILDTFSCFVQGIIPYGAQMLMASSLAVIQPVDIMSYLYYPFFIGGFALLAILFRYPKKYS